MVLVISPPLLAPPPQKKKLKKIRLQQALKINKPLFHLLPAYKQANTPLFVDTKKNNQLLTAYEQIFCHLDLRILYVSP